jgi:TetR/AcrR family transcriptional repressor of nem operon
VARTGRPRGFDEQQVLAQARDVFWSRGYEETSVQDLVDALELQRGSLYAAFGDKRSLYLKAVALYWSENRQRLETALAEGPVLPALRRLLVRPEVVTAGSATAPRGCLVGNTTAALVPADDDARALVAGAYEGFVDVVASALRRAQENGEVVSDAEPEAQAHLLLMLFQGSALVSRSGVARKRLTAGIDVALAALAAR